MPRRARLAVPTPAPAPPAPLPPSPEGGWERILRSLLSEPPAAGPVSRFAPSTTGPAHPGTLLAALLAWLDARSQPAPGGGGGDSGSGSGSGSGGGGAGSGAGACGGAGARLLLRLEDLDPARCSPGHARAMVEDLAWIGLDDWDGGGQLQSREDAAAGRAAALDYLWARGLLYPCLCSRAQIAAAGAGGGGRRAPDGGWAYPGTCRPAPGAPPQSSWREWRARGAAVRARLPDGAAAATVPDAHDGDSGGDGDGDGGGDPARPPRPPPPDPPPQEDPSLSPAGGDPTPQEDPPALPCAWGDPIVVRRDGAAAYMLAAVVDDARAGVGRVVRGRDVAPSTAAQEALRGMLGLGGGSGHRRVAYRHHLLLLEPACGGGGGGGGGGASARALPGTGEGGEKGGGGGGKGDNAGTTRGRKLAKLHGSVGAPQLRAAGYSGAEVVGFLAFVCGLRPTDAPAAPRELLAEGFSWARVRRADQVVGWDGRRLAWLGPAAEEGA